MNLKFCRKCGSSIPKKSKSCSFCGAAVRTNYTLFIRIGLCVAAAFVLFQQTGAQTNEEQMIPEEFAQEAMGDSDTKVAAAETAATTAVAAADATSIEKPVDESTSDNAFIEKLLAEVDKDTATTDPLAGIETDTKVETPKTESPNLDTLLKSIEDTKPTTVASNDKPVVTTPLTDTADTLPVLPTTPVVETELPVITPKTEVVTMPVTKPEPLVPSPEALIPPTEITTNVATTKTTELPLITPTQPIETPATTTEPAVPNNTGRLVIVIKRNAAMGVENKVVSRAYLGDVYTVTKTYGDYLWIPKVGGWINKKNVAPYQGPKITATK